MLTEEQIINFQLLYKKNFGRDISKAEALELGLSLIRLVKAVIFETTQKNENNHYQ